MNEKAKKKAIKKVLNTLNKIKWEDMPLPSRPINGGLIHTRCSSCGGIVHASSIGMITYRCSDCGKPYHDRMYA